MFVSQVHTREGGGRRGGENPLLPLLYALSMRIQERKRSMDYQSSNKYEPGAREATKEEKTQ